MSENDLMQKHQASDLFFVAGKAPCEKIEGRILPLSEARLLPADTEAVVAGIHQAAERPMEDFLRTGDSDFSFSIPGLARFRVNTYRQRGSMAAVIRIVSFDIPDPSALGIPDQVMAVAGLTSGLVLVTGTAGSGKTTQETALHYADNPEQLKRLLG